MRSYGRRTRCCRVHHFVLAVLKAAVSFGIECRCAGCAEFRVILGEIPFPQSPRRTFAPTAAQIDAARHAAHAPGAASRALAYALQFETTLRQADIIGEWVKLADARPSAIIESGTKWLGLAWAQVDEHLILRLTPSKTEETSGARTVFDLRACPMVVDEFEHVPLERRSGPLIVNELTNLPYRYTTWRDAWRRDFAAAGLPRGMWNRDVRAGGNTEGLKAGALLEDRRKVMGHASDHTTAEVYDRDVLEAHRRGSGETRQVAVGRRRERALNGFRERGRNDWNGRNAKSMR